MILLINSVSAQTGKTYLDIHSADHLAGIPLNCLQQEYPNKLNQVLGSQADLQPPESLHPAFYGCFDWHSSVHGHWMLIRLLSMFPGLERAGEIRSVINANLKPAHIEAEIQYFQGEHNKTFERTYGWAWLLKLTEALNEWDDPDARIWFSQLRPLANLLVEKYLDFLPRLTYPIRTGEHPNTAFGLSLAYDYAESTADTLLLNLIRERSMDYYANDKGCPLSWEPNGFDFLSPCLEEAHLMSKILPESGFSSWLDDFLPDHAARIRGLDPAKVSDRSDPKIVHLDGLNLSRAWCLYGMARKLDMPERAIFIQAGDRHLQASLPHIASGHYEGEHWLASFAIMAITSRP